MKIAIIGAGALGSTFGVLLHQAGHAVTVTARGENLQTIQHTGIMLSGEFGNVHALVHAEEKLVERPDLVLVCTKAQDAHDAITMNASRIDGVDTVVVQNGLEGLNTAQSLLPRSAVYGALSIIAANFTEPGRVHVTTAAATYLGRGTGAADAQALEIAAVLSEAVPVKAIDNFEGAQWTKLVVNMLNAVPAITGMTVQDVIDDRELRRIVTASMRETVRVAHALGVRFGSIQGLSDSALRLFSWLPTRLAERLPLRMRTRMGDIPNMGSTLQSIRRGQKTEVDYLNGVVVRFAESTTVAVPVNQALTDLVHEVERRGAFVSATELISRVSRQQ